MLAQHNIVLARRFGETFADLYAVFQLLTGTAMCNGEAANSLPVICAYLGRRSAGSLERTEWGAELIDEARRMV